MSHTPSEETVEKVITLGDIAAVLEDLRSQGVTLGSLNYVIERVYWRELEQEERIAEETRAYFASREQSVSP